MKDKYLHTLDPENLRFASEAGVNYTSWLRQQGLARYMRPLRLRRSAVYFGNARVASVFLPQYIIVYYDML